MLGKSTDNAHPLGCRRHGHLTAQHVHGIGQRTNTVPAQFHIVVQPAAHDVGVVVDQAGQDTLALEIDDLRARSGQRHDLAVGSNLQKQAILDGDCRGIRIGPVERRHAAVVENEIGEHGKSSWLHYWF